MALVFITPTSSRRASLELKREAPFWYHSDFLIWDDSLMTCPIYCVGVRWGFWGLGLFGVFLRSYTFSYNFWDGHCGTAALCTDMLLRESGKNMLRESLASSCSPGIYLGRAEHSRAGQGKTGLFPELWSAHKVLLVSLEGLAVIPEQKEKFLFAAWGYLSSERVSLGFPFLRCQQNRSTMEIVSQAGDQEEGKAKPGRVKF